MSSQSIQSAPAITPSVVTEGIPDEKISREILAQLMIQNKHLSVVKAHLSFYTIAIIVSFIAAFIIFS